jgi:hypothetical protein
MTIISTTVPASSLLLSDATTAGRMLVCERHDLWAAALRRELAPAGVRVWDTRSLTECWELLAATPASFVIVELTAANVENLLLRMARLPRDFPLARVAVVAARRLTGCQWLLREAGAVHYVAALRQLGPLAQLACRHLASVPPPLQSLTDRIWAGLPWGEEERG